MRKNGIYQYYVEGEDDKKIVNALKQEIGCIESGKVEKFNVIQNKFSIARIRPLKSGTTVVLVYDTDVETNIDILDYFSEIVPCGVIGSFLLDQQLKKHKGKLESGEIGIPMENSSLVLPCGIYGRWESCE